MKNRLKILLIIPPGGYYAERWKKGTLMPSLGICYIASVLEKNGHLVEIIDAHIEGFSFKKLLSQLKNSKPDLVGVTFTTENRFQGFNVIRKIKQALPNTLICAGGPHVSLAAEDTLSNIPELDFIVRGEGEETISELVNTITEKKLLENVKGISYRVGNKIYHNPPRTLIQNLDNIPFPARHLVPWEKYNFILEVPDRGKLQTANLMTSRGCPFNCNFCASSKMWGRTCRTRSVDNILEEIEILRNKYKIEALWIFDDTFTVNKKRVQEFSNKLLERRWNLSWFCEVRVDTVDKELLTLMKKSGCYSIGFGVESGSQRILDEVIGKRIDLEQVREVAKTCKELGIISNPFFIFSHPGETKEDIEKTMDMIRTWPKPSSISLSLLHIYPGTKLEEIAKIKGILPKDFSWTKENDPRITVLPTAQGNVPIFIDKLSLRELSGYIFQWRERHGYRILKKIPEVILNIHSIKDLSRYFNILLGYIHYKLFSRANNLSWGTRYN